MSTSIPTLVAAPPAFNLPSSSLESTVVDSIFRFGKIAHAVVRDNTSSLPSRIKSRFALPNGRGLATPIVYDAANDASCWPPEHAVDYALRATKHKLDSGLSDESIATTHAVTSLVSHELLAAIEYLIVQDDEDFAQLLKARSGGEGEGMWARLVWPPSAIRADMLRRLSIAGHFTAPEDAWHALERGCATLEKFLAAAERRSASQTYFFLGNSNSPSSVDAFVFSALSAVVLGQFSESSALKTFQRDSFTDEKSDKKKLPLCKRYVEHVAKSFFAPEKDATAASGLYFIDVTNFDDQKKRKKANGDDEEGDSFAEGRNFTIGMTAAAVLAFIVVSNWSVLKAIRESK